MGTEQAEHVLELVVFELKDGVRRDQFLATVDAASEWVKSQPGFISEDLSYAEAEDRWIEVVHWRTLEEAEAAANAAPTHESCAPMFGLIDMDSMLFLHGAPAVAPAQADGDIGP
jgi:hypothetical protein